MVIRAIEELSSQDFEISNDLIVDVIYLVKRENNERIIKRGLGTGMANNLRFPNSTQIQVSRQ